LAAGGAGVGFGALPYSGAESCRSRFPKSLEGGAPLSSSPASSSCNPMIPLILKTFFYLTRRSGCCLGCEVVELRVCST